MGDILPFFFFFNFVLWPHHQHTGRFPETEPRPSQGKHPILTTRPPGNFPILLLKSQTPQLLEREGPHQIHPCKCSTQQQPYNYSNQLCELDQIFPRLWNSASHLLNCSGPSKSWPSQIKPGPESIWFGQHFVVVVFLNVASPVIQKPHQLLLTYTPADCTSILH